MVREQSSVISRHATLRRSMNINAVCAALLCCHYATLQVRATYLTKKSVSWGLRPSSAAFRPWPVTRPYRLSAGRWLTQELQAGAERATASQRPRQYMHCPWFSRLAVALTAPYAHNTCANPTPAAHALVVETQQARRSLCACPFPPAPPHLHRSRMSAPSGIRSRYSCVSCARKRASRWCTKRGAE